MSNASFSHLSQIISGSTMGTLGAPDLLKCVHFEQDMTCVLISDAKFGQEKCLLMSALVVLTPP